MPGGAWPRYVAFSTSPEVLPLNLTDRIATGSAASAVTAAASPEAYTELQAAFHKGPSGSPSARPRTSQNPSTPTGATSANRTTPPQNTKAASRHRPRATGAPARGAAA